MPRRYKEESFLDIVLDILGPIAGLIFIYMILLYFTDKPKFWQWLIYLIIFTVVIIELIFLKKHLNKKIEERKEKLFLERKFQILKDLQKSNQIEYLNNFISRFGTETKKGLKYRNYVFDYDRLYDLQMILSNKGINLEFDDLIFILKYLIDQKEQKVTAESISQKPQLFANLDEADFEKLNYRLFEAMGYKVEHIGHPKDQGGDLIINKGPERIVVQAKRYLNQAVGNKAVQEAVAARNYYNCNGAIVVASSDFTQEAIALARANNTQLISKKELQILLANYLKESWA
jgi:restriction system protein